MTGALELSRTGRLPCTGLQIFARLNDSSYPDLVKVRDVIRTIEEDGWFQVRQRGSHRQFKHLAKSGLVTIAGKPNDELAPGTLNSVLKQAGLRP